MSDEERELLKYLAGALGVISQALANGAGIYELQQINQGIQRDMGDRWSVVLGTDHSVSISARVNRMEVCNSGKAGGGLNVE